VLLKKMAGVEKGSGDPARVKVGSVTRAQVLEIAKIKLPDLGTDDIERAVTIIEGTARSVGIEIK
jgi:large subunit ribosomal protein L11